VTQAEAPGEDWPSTRSGSRNSRAGRSALRSLLNDNCVVLLFGSQTAGKTWVALRLISSGRLLSKRAAWVDLDHMASTG
jgi:hypothetical protein